MNNFTDDQLRIINEMGKNMIVSASAGSGKTTVMVERIVKLMVENQVPISKFLIVTFTKASSSDMKNKLIKKLSEKEPTPFLLQQIDDIPISDISNLHSFCARLLKSHFYEVGIDPAFVVLDEVEASVIKERAMDILFREQYEQNPEFYDLIDIFSKNRKDFKLRELILRLDSFLSSESEPEEWFKKGLENYEENLVKNPSAQLLNRHIISSCKALEKECRDLIEHVNEFNQAKLVEFLQRIESNLSKVHASADYVTNSKAVLSFEKLGNIPKVDLDFEYLKEKVEIFRDAYNGVVKHVKSLATDDAEEMSKWLAITKKRIENLYSVTVRFKQIYTKLKKEKGGLDFNDLEEYTYQVLQNPEILTELKEKFEYIFVDEYQDINGMQEKIIALLSRDNNRFMVGDVKQSIYRFRLCDPQIFIDKYQSYSLDKKDSKTFDLNDNFRSHKDILDFCNFVFSRSMTMDFGGVDYASKKMKSGLDDWDNKKEGSNINLIFIDSQKEKKDDKIVLDGVYSVENHKNEVQEEEKSAVAEALVVAKNITDLMLHAKIYDNSAKKYRKIDYKDIVILTASRSEQLKEFIKTLKNLDLPVSADLVSDALDDPFVNGVRNLFSLISNSSHDEEMLNVLYSPLFNFTADNLAQISIENDDESFSEKILYGTIDDLSGNLKLQEFKQKLDRYKKYANYKVVPELLSIIENDLDLVTKIYASSNYEESLIKYNKFKACLPSILLSDYLQEKLTTIPIESTAQSNAIKVMTIHKSKGLEFPVVFMVGMGRNFNMKSIYGDCLLSKELGIGMTYFDEKARYKSETIAIKAARLCEKEKLLEEQQRLLYVGMTRAINFLYVIGSRDKSKLVEDFINPTCFLDWFTEALLVKPLDKLNIEVFDLKDVYQSMPAIDSKEMIFDKPDKNMVQLLDEKYNQKYEFDQFTAIPVKSSFTAIERENKKMVYNYSSVSSSKAIEIGNAYHKILQHISFEKNSKEFIQSEIERLFNNGLISQVDIENIEIEKLSQILSLSIFDEIRNSNWAVLREREFYYNMKVENGLNINTADKVLIQGIIDLLVIKDDCFDIIDYKTSRLQRNDLIEKYRKQVEMYSEAMTKALGKPLGQAVIVSITTGEAIKIL